MSNPPTQLGQYQIIREIARSNDIVYEAWDAQMNRRVAIKELSVPSGSTPQQVEDRISRFRREAQAVGTLNHPNIMTVFSFATDQDRHFMAMEYLDGTTLRHEIDVEGFLSQERAMQIAMDVLRGLEHAHESGVIHRDIKPDNVQITSTGQVKITDFGIARLTFQPNLTMDGQVFGTPSYMSPEQVVGKEIDARSDLFSVGVMLYEMVAGQKPFSGDNVVAIATSIANHRPPQPTQMNNALWQVVEKSIDKTAAMRYSNAAAMRIALEELSQNLASGAASSYGASGGQTPGVFLPPDPYGAGTYGPQYGSSIHGPGVGGPGMPGQGMPGQGLAGQMNQTPYGQSVQSPYNPGGGFGVGGNQIGGQYVQAPYNPYASPGAPSGQMQSVLPPVGGGPQPPPVIAAPTYGQYNPYNGPIPGQYSATPPPGYFYPPPPKQPLFKPETQAFLSRLTLMIVVLATFFGVIVFAFITVVNSAKNSSKGGGSPQRVAVVTQPGRAESSQGSPQASSSTAVKTSSDSAAFVREGMNAEKSSQFGLAEEAYRQSVSRDGSNTQALDRLAFLVYQRSRTAGTPDQQAKLLEEAGRSWAQAAENAPNDRVASQWRESSGKSYFEAATVLNAAGRSKSTIRPLLYLAQDLTSPGSELSIKIENALANQE